MVVRATAAHRRMRRGKSMVTSTIMVGKVALGMHRPRMSTMAIVRHRRRWCATIAGRARTMHGYKVRAFLRNIGVHAMSSMTGVVTVCTSRRVATTGCNTVVTTCWWP